MNASVWRNLILSTSAAVAMALLIGWLLGHVGLAVAVVLAALLMRQLYMLQRLLLWLRSDRADQVPDAGGAWGDVIGLIAKLFRRKQYHKRRMRQLVRELRHSTAAIPDGVVMLNPAAEILWFNRSAAELLNLRSPGDVGLRIDNLVRRPEFVNYLRHGEYRTPVVVQGAGNSEKHLHFQMVPYGTGQLLLMVRDVTREVRLETMRKDFVANASHELRSPLTVISGYLETLSQDESIEPVLHNQLQEMRRQALRMNAIVHDLLELSRLEAEGGMRSEEPVDVGALLAQLRSELLARSPRLQVKLQVDTADRLRGEPAQLHSAFANLLDNAAKYTPAEGSIEMRWWSDAQGGHLSVRDSGIGIAPQHIPRLTERFYRVDPGRSRASGGSGLGLAIVKHVLQHHEGTLQIVSEEGHGSTFSCHFPVARLLPHDGPAPVRHAAISAAAGL